ncbi:hypothetical protein MJM45_32295, partial [Salmonella enterica subsp. enterica serovar Kentucky]|nr:hypothetical protein [Salmonella enterica subsp. enterica serovar Kentucky]
ALDGFSIGMGATGAMFVLGSLREILGNGTLFDGADSLLGGWASNSAQGSNLLFILLPSTYAGQLTSCVSFLLVAYLTSAILLSH